MSSERNPIEKKAEATGVFFNFQGIIPKEDTSEKEKNKIK